MAEVVATGAPRSGTRYLAALLGWAHESTYTYDHHGPAPAPEVSWAAAPYLDPQRTFVIHLVRDPAQCVASIIATGWLNPDNPWGRFAHDHTGTWDPWQFWIAWTVIVERIAHATVRLEDIAHLGAPLNGGGGHPIDVPERWRLHIDDAALRFGYPFRGSA